MVQFINTKFIHYLGGDGEKVHLEVFPTLKDSAIQE